jgi:hypothetical protein
MSTESRSAVIEVSRARGGFRDVFRTYKVNIDGVQRSQLRRGETTELEVDAGTHSVKLTIDKFWGSQEVEIWLGEGERGRLEAKPTSPLGFQLFGAGHWIKLSKLDDPVSDDSDPNGSDG